MRPGKPGLGDKENEGSDKAREAEVKAKPRAGTLGWTITRSNGRRTGHLLS
jgi:hypothetical protein